MGFDILEIRPLIPELFIIVCSMMLLMVGAFRGNRATPAIYLSSIMVSVIALYLVTKGHSDYQASFHQMFITDGFIRMSKMLLLLGTVLVLIISGAWLQHESRQRFEYPILILFSTTGLMLMISAGDLISLYMGLELSSLALYVLASFERDSVSSTEAGLKYFVLGALASGMMLFGASLVYGFAGTTNFNALADLFARSAQLQAVAGEQVLVHMMPQSSLGVLVGVIFLITGLCFKVSAVPFHMWTPDVYEGAPTPVTAFFAVVPKIGGIILFTRVMMDPFAALVFEWQQVVIFVSVASMIVGAFGALRQTNIKLLLAYSSIGHVGYVLIGLAAASAAGLQSILIYLGIYLFMSAGAFGCVLLMQRRGEYVEDITELAGLYKTRPYMAFALAIFMFAMAGIPPLAGFFGKMYVFLAAVDAGLYGLAVVGVLTSVVACYYYLKIVKLMFFDEAREPFDTGLSLSLRYTLALCTIFTLFFFLFPTPLVSCAKAAVTALVL